MVIRARRNRVDPDLGVLAGQLLFAVESELFAALALEGFDDLHPRHSAVLAHIDVAGVRATELSRLSGQHKQVIGRLVGELEALGYVERTPDPADRRAKLVCPTERGRARMVATARVLRSIQERHARSLGHDTLARFRATLIDVTEHQRRHALRSGVDGGQ